MTAQNDLARLLGVMDASGLDIETDLGALPDLIEKQALLDAFKKCPAITGTGICQNASAIVS